MKHNRLKYSVLSLLMILSLSLISCRGTVPSEYAGEWEGQINPSQKVVLNIDKDGKYELTIYQTRERYDAIYEGKIVMDEDNFIKLPSNSYTRKFNSNRRDSDPFYTFVEAETTFLFNREGALSKSPKDLNNPVGHLHKIK